MFGQHSIPWLHVFVELLLKSTLALSLALIITTFIRNKSSSMRHFVLAFFLIGLLFIPILTLFQFGWQTNLLPSRITAENLDPAVTNSKILHSRPHESVLHAQKIEEWIPALTKKSKAIGSSQSHSFPASSVPSASRIMNFFLIMIWAGGMLLLLLRICLGLFEASRMTKEGKQVDDPAWRILMDRFLSLIGLSRRIRLKSHKKVLVPLTWGLIKPVIMIPSDYKAWTEDQKSAALFHELSHIKRSDFLITLLVRFSLALFWFNPLSWFVFRRMKSEQEKACDELVLRAGIKPSIYAANLLLFRDAAGFRWTPSAALLSIFGRSSFSERLSAILKQKQILKEVTMKTKLVISVTVILAVAIIGTARPSSSAPEFIPGSMILSLDDTNPRSYPVDAEFNEEEQKTQSPAETKVNVQEEKEKQEKKSKKADKHITVITTKKGKKVPIEITVIEGDEKKKIKIEKSVTIKKGKNGKVILLDPEGDEIEVIEGKPIRLTIKEGDVEFVGDDKTIKIDKEGVVCWIAKGQEGEEDLEISILGDEKARKILKIGEADTHGWTIKKVEGVEGEDIHVICTDKLKAVGIAKDKDARIIIKPGEDDKHVYWVGEALKDEDEIVDRIKKIREALKKLEDEGTSVEEIMDLLNELEEKLEKHEKSYVKGHIFHKKPGTLTLAKKIDGKEFKKDLFISEGEKIHTVATIVDEEGKVDVIYSISTGGKSREVYEKTVERLKKELPAEFTLEPEFNEKSGVIIFKIKGIGGEDFSKDFIKKLTEIIKEEIKNGDN
jgi:beta-lactamase regulating signal transducer with metallopeptidase domain